MTREKAKQAFQAILWGEKEITDAKTFHKFEDELFPEIFKKFDDDGDGKIQGKEIEGALNELRARL